MSVVNYPNGTSENREDVALKPCPFCGSEAELVWTHTSVPHPFVRCRFGEFKHPKCHGTVTVTHEYYQEEEAVEAWNRRAKA